MTPPLEPETGAATATTDRTLAAGAPLCLVTGATGYVGGRLVPELLAAGLRVRCMTRSRDRLRDQPWADQVEIADADAADTSAVRRALEGVDVAYYLIHSMNGGPRFEDVDRTAALSFAAAVRGSGLRRLVYLGGLAPRGVELSPHMRSRQEVGAILSGSEVPTTVFAAGVIIGSGSASFEMLRYLTERLPVMITPRWVGNRVQPIAVRDVLRYLVHAAGLPPEVSGTYDIGGPDVLSYRAMMRRYAEVADLPPRVVLTLPVLTPSLSSLWVGLVTPIPSALARPLVESVRHDAVCRGHAIAEHIPDPPEGLLGFDEAVKLALQRVQDAVVATRWSSASVAGAPSDPLPSDPSWAGGSLYTDDRERATSASPQELWNTIEGIGGANGWYSLSWAWQVRGLVDRAVGGVGLRRGRRDPLRLRIGDAVDFWRVEEIEAGRLLRLRAEMRLPGLAWLELRVEDDPAGSRYRQRAVFHPHGLLGQLYWWSVRPFHGIVFGAMARNITRTAAARHGD
jgi:uncharacterized protein YbjT (DUF2867 family)